MANKNKPLSWGKCKIMACKLNDAGDPTGEWVEFDTPVEDSTQLSPTKGDKVEAKVEGGGVEGVRQNPNSYTLQWKVRQGAGTRTVEDFDGVIAGTYAVRIIPESPQALGAQIDACVLSASDNYTTKEGAIIEYTADVLTPKAGRQVKWQRDATTSTNSVVVILTGDGGNGGWRLQGESSWRSSGERAYFAGTGAKTVEYKPVASKTAPTQTSFNAKAGGDNALVAEYK